MSKYDYLIVGAGLFGSVFAYEATKKGKKCLVIDKRNHIGGNVFTEKIAGINVHKYGAHIFHTNDKKIWDYINQFVEFNRFTNSPIANYKNEIYNMPFNMNTFNKLWGVITPEEAKNIIKKQKQEAGIKNPSNLEEQAISLVGTDIYKKLVKGYTEKQWGRSAKNLPSFIIKRLPVRFTYDNNYFNDKYQGIPIGGYTKIFEKLLAECDVYLGTDFFENKSKLEALADKVVYTGMIDQFYNYKFGILEYRSLRFETELLEGIENYQGNAVVNYTDRETPFTRIIEHKHFEFGAQKDTVITKEYPKEWKLGDEPYYPINDSTNNLIYNKYKELAKAEEKVIFGGRLATYKYYDMHQVIASALVTVQKELG
ncbi:UDP-galactopyranose mutase [Heyndrickxia coagulans]|uniref:UDP-galactopyranose mutase n=1 Tax=Heyndrickxia coagulans TaxID=1398 RepID=UPI002DF8FCE6|nr:UDP-galactopyranose mutase [Heyndrickxia coagulans]MEC5270229.1 UDP-galactopyranose mutase [Heyndrickxia coagulans]